MANITRIKAGDPGKSKDEPKKPKNEPVEVEDKPIQAKTDVKQSAKDKKAAKAEAKKQKKLAKKDKKPFILIRPIVYFGRYLRDSWREIRQVRWPSRKATWKLFFAIIIYTFLFGAIIMLLDIFFTWLFNLIIG